MRCAVNIPLIAMREGHHYLDRLRKYIPAGSPRGLHKVLASRILMLLSVGVLGSCMAQDDGSYGGTSESNAAQRVEQTFSTDEKIQELGHNLAGESTVFAKAIVSPTAGNDANGVVRIVAEPGRLWLHGQLHHLNPGIHGMHIHSNGDCSAPDASTAGEYYDPDGDPHGSPNARDELHHLGDLGNIVADESGSAKFDIFNYEMTLDESETSIVNRALIVHAGPDDLTSQPSGDSGDRVGCGVVRPLSSSEPPS